MSDDKFDAIVVGAGVAGSVAALVMARAGLDVLVIERGDSAGCKNMTGGRLYAHTLEAIIPGFAASAPIERKVTREKISFLTEESAVTLDFHREQPDVPQHASYTVLRNRLDPWLSRILLWNNCRFELLSEIKKCKWYKYKICIETIMSEARYKRCHTYKKTYFSFI